MASAAQPTPNPVTNSAPNGERRRSILDLAPFELDCMNALWPLGEATVKQVQESLMARRPRAYTTIMTILDRLAQKGIVTRRKSGRAYLYRASLQVSEAQQSAVQQLVTGFFGGSREALAAHLSGAQAPLPSRPARIERVAPVSAPVESAKPVAKPEVSESPSATSELDRTLL
jgi:BlaI family penicillinase repressor